MTTARLLLARLHARLVRAGVPEPSTNARYILAAALGRKSVLDADVAVRSREVLAGSVAARADALLVRRCRREPLQSVLGEWDFDVVRNLVVRCPVLIPRPETEQLVEIVSSHIRALLTVGVASPVVLELGCGSGAISIALLMRHPQLRIVAVDISREAVALTLENAIQQGVADRLVVVEVNVAQQLLDGDNVLRALASFGGGPAPLLVSNPPYIPDRLLGELQPEVRRWEDPRALCGGEHEGLDVPLAFLNAAVAAKWVTRDASALMEVHTTHPALLRHILAPRHIGTTTDGAAVGATTRASERSGNPDHPHHSRYKLDTLPAANGFAAAAAGPWLPSPAEERAMDAAATALAPVVTMTALRWAWRGAWSDHSGQPRFVHLQTI